MKITDVRCLPLQYPLSQPLQFAWGPMRHRNFALVIIETDAGVRGLGESSVNFPAWAIKERRHTIEDGLRPLLIDEDPLRIEYLWDKLYRALNRLGILWGRGAILSAISAVDMALWDLAGRALGVPVYQLLGGLTREHIPLYATGIDISRAEQYIEQGYRAVKVRLGFGQERDLQTLETVRRAIGDAHLLADVNMGWSRAQALAMLPLLETFGLYWLEEPLPADDYEGYALLARTSRIPLAAGENAFDRQAARAALETGALRYLMPDPSRTGGLSECRKICALAAAYNVEYSPHHFGSDVGFAAALHLCASTPGGGYMLRDVSPAPLRESVLREPIRIVDGSARVPDAPGLGIELNEDTIEQYAMR